MAQNPDSTKYGSEESLTKVLVDNEGHISTVAGECLMACSFLPMNLLWLCYLGTEGVRDTSRHYRDQKVRVTQFKVGGDFTDAF